jgi:hypothetical protein
MSRSWEWGPPGLETPKQVPGAKRLYIAAAFCLAVTFAVPWCRDTFGYVDLDTGKRRCPVIPSEIRSWSVVGDMRKPGEAETLQKWIARHPRQINKHHGAFCETLLHVAATWGREDLAQLLITGGADVEARNGLDERPLHVAAKYGRPTVVKLLLASGADVNASGPHVHTPLHSASCGLGTQSNIAARIQIAKLLLAASADVNAPAPGSGFTALRCATSYESRNPGMAELLLAHGANPRGAQERLH